MEAKSHTNNIALIPDITPIDVAEQVEVMRLQEQSTYQCKDFFGETDSCTQGTSLHRPQHIVVVDAECRRKMCQWQYQIVDFCHFRRETVDIAMSYLDRFLSTGSSEAQRTLQDKRRFQLACVTGLYLAIKLHETMEMEAAVLEEIGRGQYSAEDIVAMERIMLGALKWRVNGPTRLSFALRFLALLPAQARDDAALVEKIMALIHVQAEEATLDYFFTTRKQSTAGLACVLNALKAVGIADEVMDEFMDAVIRYGGMNPFSSEVEEAQERLVCAAVASEQLFVSTSLKMEKVMVGASATKISSVQATEERDDDEKTSDNRQSSPVCVSRTAVLEQ